MNNENEISFDVDLNEATFEPGDSGLKLLEALRDGSPEAYREVYLQWRKPLYGLLYKLTGSHEDADDVTQDVFIRLWENHHKVDPSRNIRALLYLIARQLALRLIKKRRIHENYTVDFEFDEINYEDSSDIIVAKEMELLKQIVLSRMSEQRRLIWQMNSEEGLSANRIAERLGLSVQTVYNQLSSARQELKELLACLLIFLSLSK